MGSASVGIKGTHGLKVEMFWEKHQSKY